MPRLPIRTAHAKHNRAQAVDKAVDKAVDTADKAIDSAVDTFNSLTKKARTADDTLGGSGRRGGGAWSGA